MARSTKQSLTRHDQAVKRSADAHARSGHKVKADVEGYPHPRTYNGRRPDLEVKVGSKTVLKEFETRESAKSDSPQQRDLRRYAREHKNVRFEKKRVQ
jgi:hypothetical protein